jgi:DNA-binding transcriptional LysR family regulator
MELRHLRYFTAVAETRHFGLAAERLHMAQPALSHSIRQLEREIGAKLFARTTRQVSLTPAGELLYRDATRVLASIEDSVRGVKRLADGTQGLVRIGFTGTAAFSQLPRIARVVNEQLPEVALEIHADLLTPAQVDGLVSARLDLGVLRPPVAGADLTLRTITTESLVLALPADHRLIDEPGVVMQDLRTENWVMYTDEHSAMNEAMLRNCRAAGFAPHRGHTAPSTGILLALVAAGLGVALVPESVRNSPLTGVVFLDLPDAARIELALAWRRDEQSPVVSKVLRTLESSGLFDNSYPTQEAAS